jgi:hypothetical protein
MVGEAAASRPGVVCVSLIALRALLNRHRMSHHNGIVGAGASASSTIAIPDTDFFRPGREFPSAAACVDFVHGRRDDGRARGLAQDSPMPTSTVRSIC